MYDSCSRNLLNEISKIVDPYFNMPREYHFIIDEVILIVLDPDHDNYKTFTQTPFNPLPFH